MSRLLGALGGPWSALFFRLAVGGFFVAAALAKLARPAELFAAQIRSFGLAPEAWALPWVELFSGGLLLAGLFSGAAALAVAVQLGLFSAALGVALAAGKAPEDCGCIPGLQ
ncbi:MAG: DoxX family membrane protein, partial [Candidatus Tectomicrobia bacterium]|nr:DoxX family membrane protein [Candidatus Tectomicrobia bacterium]